MAKKCWCSAPLRADGFCRYRCDPALKPAAIKRRVNEEKRKAEAARIESERLVSSQDHATTSAAVAKFDPIAAHVRARSLRILKKRHGRGR